MDKIQKQLFCNVRLPHQSLCLSLHVVRYVGGKHFVHHSFSSFMLSHTTKVPFINLKDKRFLAFNNIETGFRVVEHSSSFYYSFHNCQMHLKRWTQKPAQAQRSPHRCRGNNLRNRRRRLRHLRQFFQRQEQQVSLRSKTPTPVNQFFQKQLLLTTDS